MQIRPDTHSPALRIGATLAGTFAVLVTILAIARPEMMSMAMLHHLIVGFGL